MTPPNIVMSLSLLVLMPVISTVPAWAFMEETQVKASPCTNVVYGDVSGTVTLTCPDLSEQQVANLTRLVEKHLAEQTRLMEENLAEQTRNLRQKNNHIDLLHEKLSSMQETIIKLSKQRQAGLQSNADDQQKNPLNPLLEQEKAALEAFDFIKAHELRELYYRKFKANRTQRLEEIYEESAQEAMIAAQSAERVLNWQNALTYYQEAVEFKPGLLEAWRKIIALAEKIGHSSRALAATQSLLKQLSPDEQPHWYAIALTDQADILVAFGEGERALAHYQQMFMLLNQLAKKSPDDLSVQRDLSISHERMGSVHQASGDSTAALQAYQAAFTIHRQLVKLDPSIVQWQTDLVVSYFKLSQVQPKNATALLRKALNILKRLQAENRLGTDKQAWISIIENELR